MTVDLHGQEGSSRYVALLSMLLLIFCGRVLAQFIQSVYPLSFLPTFDSWQSGALPYWMLLVSQLIIVMLCLLTIRGLHYRLTTPSLPRGVILLGLGVVYVGVMLVRLIVGLTIATDHYWFSAKLPTVFHLVLAMFVLIYGHFHYRYGSLLKTSSMGTL